MTAVAARPQGAVSHSKNYAGTVEAQRAPNGSGVFCRYLNRQILCKSRPQERSRKARMNHRRSRCTG